jgi:TetR/AcrR family transcriptional regulator
VRVGTEEVRLSIRGAALAAFRQRGYRGTTLDDIASTVGLTRGALLHHFHSKAALLGAVLDPFLGTLDAVLEDTRVDDPPTLEQRRQLLHRLAGLALAYRPEVALFLGDIGTRAQVEVSEESTARGERLITLLVGGRAPGPDRVRAAAVLGALLFPAAWAGVDLGTDEAHAAWLETCMGLVGPPERPPPCPIGRTSSSEPTGIDRVFQGVTG